MIIPLIMSGGSGTRLWPLSRRDVPKQFHALVDERTMFAHTLARVGRPLADISFAAPVVIFNERHLPLVTGELAAAGVAPAALVAEPMGRNTAPAVAAAILATGSQDSATLMLMLPADHLIANPKAFHEAIAAGAEAARDGALVTFGILPDRPETGFGYIRRGPADGRSFKVEAFVEKPDRATAEQYLASGDYSWNAGIFLFRTDVMAAEIAGQRPAMWQGVEAALRTPDAPAASAPPAGCDAADAHLWRLDPQAFAAVDGESLDYAVMEGARRVNVVPVDMGWDDIGSWSQLHAASPRDEAANTLKGDVIAIDTRDSYVRADQGLVATVGVQGLIVVQTGDATLIANRGAVQDVKRVVDELHAKGRREADETAAAPGPVRRPAAARREEVRRWLFEAALPFWADAGIDPATGTIVETLSADASHHPAGTDQSLRLRVWARQLYVFSHARELGWDGDGNRIIDRAFDHLTRLGWHRDGGFIHTTDRKGAPRDERRDTYDHAFCLLAFAHMSAATGRGDAADWLARTANVIEGRLRDDKPGLYLEGLPATLPRRANPHMHLLEAWLAAYETTGDEAHLARADAIVEQFYDRFFDGETWTVIEFLDENFNRAPGEAGRIAEPGHHYEWIWLLKRHAAARRDATAHDAVCRKLFAFAEAFGLNHATGMVYDTVTCEGMPLATTSRCWPQTEALKALIALDRTGTVPGLAPRIDETLAVLLDRTLADAPAGCWMDRYDRDGRPIAPDIPASTFYHLFVAFAEVLKT